MNSLLRIFPVPKFLTLSALAIDISDASVKYLALFVDKGKVVLGPYGDEPLPAGVVSSGGKIEHAAELVKVLAKIESEHSLGHVALALPEEQAYLVELRLPFMKESELRGSLELSLEEYIPLPLAETIFDYEIVSRPATPKDSYDLAVGALPQTLVQSYLSACTEAGMNPLSFEIEAHALARAVIPRDAEGSYMIVDLGKTRTGFAIGDAQRVMFSSTVPLGGDAITKALVKQLAITYEKAEELKTTKGLSRAKGDEALFEALIPVLSALKDEVGKHYAFWHSHPDSGGVKRVPIRKIFLVGGQANMPGLADYLSSGLGCVALAGNPWVNIPLASPVPLMPYPVALRFVTTIGLALRHLVI